jgi:hypothetical protein
VTGPFGIKTIVIRTALAIDLNQNCDEFGVFRVGSCASTSIPPKASAALFLIQSLQDAISAARSETFRTAQGCHD